MYISPNLSPQRNLVALCQSQSSSGSCPWLCPNLVPRVLLRRRSLVLRTILILSFFSKVVLGNRQTLVSRCINKVVLKSFLCCRQIWSRQSQSLCGYCSTCAAPWKELLVRRGIPQFVPCWRWEKTHKNKLILAFLYQA